MVFCVDFGVIPTLWDFVYILELFRHCGILCRFWKLFRHCGILELFRHFGILELFRHWYFGVIPTLVFCLDFGVIPTLVFCVDFGVIPTLWYFV